MPEYIGHYSFTKKVTAANKEEAEKKLEQKMCDIAEACGTEFVANMSPDTIEEV